MMNWIRENMLELVGAVTVILLSYIIGNHMTTASVADWYEGLVKPALYPPHLVWFLVGLFLNYSFGRAIVKVWKTRAENGLLLFVFIVQALINLVGLNYIISMQCASCFFYGILAGWTGSLAILYLARKNKEVFGLIYPYTIWTTFAAYLYYQIAFVLN